MKTELEIAADKLASAAGAHLFYYTCGSGKELAEALKEYEKLRPQQLWPPTNYRMGFEIKEAPMGAFPTGVVSVVISKRPFDPSFDPKKDAVVLRQD